MSAAEPSRPWGSEPEDRARFSALALLLLASALPLCACGSPPPPTAAADEGVPDLATGATTLRAHLDAIEAALPSALAGGDGAGAPSAAVDEHVRAIVRLCASEAFLSHPLLRGELRTRIHFVASGPEENRRAALARCRELAARLAAPSAPAGRSEAPRLQTPAGS